MQYLLKDFCLNLFWVKKYQSFSNFSLYKYYLEIGLKWWFWIIIVSPNSVLDPMKCLFKQVYLSDCFRRTREETERCSKVLSDSLVKTIWSVIYELLRYIHLTWEMSTLVTYFPFKINISIIATIVIISMFYFCYRLGI